MIRQVSADGRVDTGGAFKPIRRQRVTDRIASAAQQRIALIVAPAGYGKSVALREYLSTLRDDETAIFNVRAEHNTLLGFVRGFSEAVAGYAPDARKTASGAYEKNAASKTPGLDLAMWMHAHIKTMSGVIAIDDLQVAEADPEITRFVVSLIERTRGRLRWILSSRSALDLPVGSWLAYGEMDLNIDEHDLAFTVDEARETAKSVRVSVRDEELQQILQMTSGWPTALSFALRTSTRSVDLRNIAASTREMVYRYLAEQVYGSLAQEDRELLQLIAFLPEIDLAVLRHAGYTRAKAQIESLRDRVAFIYPERPGVYRAHDLFADFLRHEVELQGDEALRAVHLRAGRALERAGHGAAALRAYASIRAEDELLRLLAAQGFALMDHAHGDSIALALDALEPRARSEEPAVLALRALREADAGKLDRAESLLNKAIEKSGDALLRADLAVRLAMLLFNQGRDVIALLEPYARQETLPVEMQARVLSVLVPAYAFSKAADEVRSVMQRAEDFAVMVDSDEVRARLYHRLGLAALTLQLPAETVNAYFNRAHVIAGEISLYVTAAAALGGLENVALLYEDDLTKAAWLAQQSMNAALKAGARFAVLSALLQLSHIEMRRGTPDRLRSLERQFATSLTSDVNAAFYIVPARSMLAAWDGRFDEAHRMLASAADRSTYLFDRLFHATLLALYAAGAGDRDRTVTASARAVELLNEGGFEYLHGARTADLCRGMLAFAEALTGRTTVAARLLLQRPGATSPAAEAMRECAAAAIRAVKNPSLSDEVTEAIGHVQTAGAGGIALLLDRVCAAALEAKAGASHPLTRAETEVLQALADGSSPKDIAQRTGRSVYTIQAHIQNVIKKLGCSGRSEALSLARKNGIVKFN